jgi:hypothetical protein
MGRTGAETSLKDFAKTYDEFTTKLDNWRCRTRCSAAVPEFQSLPDLDANANAVAIAKLKLDNEGWEKDYEVPEPSEPTFTEPPV